MIKVIKKKFPWWGKIILKIILSRFPINYSKWRDLLFAHGEMKDPKYAFNIFERHLKVYSDKIYSESNFLELGPGDSLSSGIIAKSFGFNKSYLIDVGSYASKNIDVYNSLVSFLRMHKTDYSQKNFQNITDLLKFNNISYMTEGVSSLKSIESNSIKFIWSEAVLEHIYADEFEDLVYELRRILREDGIISSRIDLRDHLDENLNHLRFPKAIWESYIFRNSGFYTNRLGYSQMIEIFHKMKFKVESKIIYKWDSMPIKIEKLSEDFRKIDKEDLCVKVFDVVLKK